MTTIPDGALCIEPGCILKATTWREEDGETWATCTAHAERPALAPSAQVAHDLATRPEQAARWAANAAANERRFAERLILADLDDHIREARLNVHDGDGPGRYHPALRDHCLAAVHAAEDALLGLALGGGE